MRSQWIEHKGKKIFYQDFSKLFYNSAAVKAASASTKAHIRKTAVLGVTGGKRKLADLLSLLTGQPLKYFDDMEVAKHWLVED